MNADIGRMCRAVDFLIRDPRLLTFIVRYFQARWMGRIFRGLYRTSLRKTRIRQLGLPSSVSHVYLLAQSFI